jgi:hypothetical protein
VGLLLLPWTVGAVRDLQVPDDMWPRDQLEQFDVVADDAGADAAEIEDVLLETAVRLGLNADLGHAGSSEKCRLPDGSVGKYIELYSREYFDPTNDQATTAELVSEYWDSLGYTVGEVYDPSGAGETLSLGAGTPSGGHAYIMMNPDSTELGGHSGCSAADEAP